jgi:hypothetical protein
MAGVERGREKFDWRVRAARTTRLLPGAKRARANQQLPSPIGRGAGGEGEPGFMETGLSGNYRLVQVRFVYNTCRELNQ